MSRTRLRALCYLLLLLYYFIMCVLCISGFVIVKCYLCALWSLSLGQQGLRVCSGRSFACRSGVQRSTQTHYATTNAASDVLLLSPRLLLSLLLGPHIYIYIYIYHSWDSSNLDVKTSRRTRNACWKKCILTGRHKELLGLVSSAFWYSALFRNPPFLG